MNYTIVDPDPGPTVRSLGTVNGLSTSDTAALKKQFPNSPINLGHLTDIKVKRDFATRVMRGDVPESAAYYGSNGDINRNFEGPTPKLSPPDYNFKYEHPGDPASSFMPNVTSGDPNNPKSQPAPRNVLLQLAHSKESIGSSAFVGEGTALSPKKASEKLVKKSAFTKKKQDEWTMGESGAHSSTTA